MIRRWPSKRLLQHQPSIPSILSLITPKIQEAEEAAITAKKAHFPYRQLQQHSMSTTEQPSLQEQKNAFAAKENIQACVNPNCKFSGCTCGSRCGCNRGCTNPNCTCSSCTCGNSCGCNGGNPDPEKALDQSCDPCKDFKAKKAAEAK